MSGQDRTKQDRTGNNMSIALRHEHISSSNGVLFPQFGQIQHLHSRRNRLSEEFLNNRRVCHCGYGRLMN
jgi:hypothetical protein